MTYTVVSNTHGHVAFVNFETSLPWVQPEQPLISIHTSSPSPLRPQRLFPPVMIPTVTQAPTAAPTMVQAGVQGKVHCKTALAPPSDTSSRLTRIFTSHWCRCEVHWVQNESHSPPTTSTRHASSSLKA
ncbi:hypothetical protein CPC08DRAFT_251899 [Agrocybe pediades]|nr:hypothetical protein CPC08DRAFT_251899 [Agrocybe pediades]